MESINKKSVEVKEFDYKNFISLHEFVTLTISIIAMVIVATIITFGALSLLISP